MIYLWRLPALSLAPWSVRRLRGVFCVLRPIWPIYAAIVVYVAMLAAIPASVARPLVDCEDCSDDGIRPDDCQKRLNRVHSHSPGFASARSECSAAWQDMQTHRISSGRE